LFKQWLCGNKSGLFVLIKEPDQLNSFI